MSSCRRSRYDHVVSSAAELTALHEARRELREQRELCVLATCIDLTTSRILALGLIYLRWLLPCEPTAHLIASNSYHGITPFADAKEGQMANQKSGVSFDDIIQEGRCSSLTVYSCGN